MHSSNRLTAIGFVALASCGHDDESHIAQSLSTSQIASVIEFPAGSTLLIGRGYNSLKGEALGPCVKSTARETIGGGRGQNTSFVLRHVDSVESLSESLNLSVAGAYGKGLFKGSAKAGFLHSKDMSSHSSFLLVSVKVENQTEVLQRYEYEENAKALLRSGRRSEFLARCGDEFVAAKTTGGEFTAIVEFTSKTQEEKRDIEVQLRANGGIYKVSSEFKSSLERLSKYADTKVTILRSGSSGNLPNLDNLVAEALSFPSKITDTTGWPFSVTTLSYDAVLDGAREGLPRPVSLRKQAHFLEGLLRSKLTLVQLRNDVEYILRNQNQFQNVDVASLNASKNEIEAGLLQAESAPSACFDKPEIEVNCRVPEIAIPNVNYPVRFSNGNAVCAWRREDALRSGKITRRQFDAMMESNRVPVFYGDRHAEIECAYFVKEM